MGALNLSSIKRFIKHFSEWGLAWHKAKKEKNHYYSFFPPSPFHFLQTVSLFSCSYKQSHATSVGVLVICATDGYFKRLFLSHWSFSISGRFSYSLWLSENKGMAVGESHVSFQDIWLPWQRCLFRHSRVPAATVTISHGQGTAFGALGEPRKGRNALHCHISDRRTPESRGWWGEGCFCRIPKVVGSDHWRWKASSCLAVPLHSPGAETTQTTSPYKMLFWAVWNYHRWGLTNAVTGKFLQPGSQ